MSHERLVTCERDQIPKTRGRIELSVCQYVFRQAGGRGRSKQRWPISRRDRKATWRSLRQGQKPALSFWSTWLVHLIEKLTLFALGRGHKVCKSPKKDCDPYSRFSSNQTEKVTLQHTPYRTGSLDGVLARLSIRKTVPGSSHHPGRLPSIPHTTVQGMYTTLTPLEGCWANIL